jgi:hypothetical protein
VGLERPEAILRYLWDMLSASEQIPDVSRGRRGRLWRRSRESRSPVFCTIMLALLHRAFQFFLVAGKQNMDLAMCFVADSMNLRTEDQAPAVKLSDSN